MLMVRSEKFRSQLLKPGKYLFHCSVLFFLIPLSLLDVWQLGFIGCIHTTSSVQFTQLPMVDDISNQQPVPKSWTFLTDESIQNWDSSTKGIIESAKSDASTIQSVLYEICVSLIDSRIPIDQLIAFTNQILRSIDNTDQRRQVSTSFLIIFNSFHDVEPKFVEDLDIDVDLKRRFLRAGLLRPKLFTDYNKLYYEDAKVHAYGLELYSSLGESSEGYSKYAMTLYNYLRLKAGRPSMSMLVRSLQLIRAHFKLDLDRCLLVMISVLGYLMKINLKVVDDFIIQCGIWSTSKASQAWCTSVLMPYLSSDPKISIGEMEVIAVLAKHQYVDFDAILQVLKPGDFGSDGKTSGFESIYETYETELEGEALSSSASALAMAAPLIQDDEDEHAKSATPKVPESKPQAKPEPVSVQIASFPKVHFISSLLKLKMYDQALYALACYPHLPIMDTNIADLVNDLAKTFVEPYYRALVKPFTLIPPREEAEQSKISTTEELFTFCNEFVAFNGSRISRDPALLTELIRIMRKSLENGEDKQLWLNFYRQFILPASFCTSNVTVTTELSSLLLEFFTLEDRYNIYGEYLSVSVKKSLELKVNYAKANKQTKNFLKRLSVDNLASSKFEFCQLMNRNPLASTEALLTQVESYSSLIKLVVKGSYSLSGETWDALTFQIVNHLTGRRPPVQADGLNYNVWFLNLADFIGKMAKDHYQSIALKPILDLIVKSLNSGSTEYVLIFKNIIEAMTGIKQINNLTHKQIFELNAGRSIRDITYLILQDHRSKQKSSSSRLLSVMNSSSYLSEMFILLCNLSSDMIHHSKAPVKILNNKCDELNSLLHTFTQSVAPYNEYFQKGDILPVEQMVQEYQIAPEWAFELWRGHWGKVDSNAYFTRLREKLPELITQVDWKLVTPTFYSTFWQLSLYDIDYNRLSYDQEKQQAETMITRLKQELQHKDAIPMREVAEIKQKVSELAKFVPLISKNGETHKSDYEEVMKRISNEKDGWLADGDESALSKQLLQYCLLPRALQSSFDAEFASQFVIMMNEVGAKNFSLANLTEILFTGKYLEMILFANTRTETENLSIFYYELLTKLNSWRKDSKLFAQDIKSLNGPAALQHEEFRKKLYGWHESILQQLLRCLDSKHYSMRNNSLVFAKGILASFPVVESQADELDHKLLNIGQSDPREDIKLACQTLHVQLVSGRGNLIPEWDFYKMDEDKEKAERSEYEAKIEKLKEKKIAAEKLRREKAMEEEAAIRAQKVKDAEKAKEEAKAQAEKVKTQEISDNGDSVKPYGLVGLGKAKEGESDKKEGEKKDGEKKEERKEGRGDKRDGDRRDKRDEGRGDRRTDNRRDNERRKERDEKRDEGRRNETRRYEGRVGDDRGGRGGRNGRSDRNERFERNERSNERSRRYEKRGGRDERDDRRNERHDRRNERDDRRNDRDSRRNERDDRRDDRNDRRYERTDRSGRGGRNGRNVPREQPDARNDRRDARQEGQREEERRLRERNMDDRSSRNARRVALPAHPKGPKALQRFGGNSRKMSSQQSEYLRSRPARNERVPLPPPPMPPPSSSVSRKSYGSREAPRSRQRSPQGGYRGRKRAGSDYDRRRKRQDRH